MARVGDEGKKEHNAGTVCLLEQARWALTGLEFPSEVIWFLDSCQDLPSMLAEYRVPAGITRPGGGGRSESALTQI